MKQIKFILRCKIPSMGPDNEYQYMIEVISNTGRKYISYDTWHGYAPTAKEAKEQILFNIGQTQAIDYLLEDQVIKDKSNIPYFEFREPVSFISDNEKKIFFDKFGTN